MKSILSGVLFTSLSEEQGTILCVRCILSIGNTQALYCTKSLKGLKCQERRYMLLLSTASPRMMLYKPKSIL
jgi:hypothetical protein